MLTVGVVPPRPLEDIVCDMHDWPKLLRLAHQHRMVSLVGARLEALPLGTIPLAELAVWRAMRLEQVGSALAAAGELARLVGALRQRSVDVLAYKGPALAQAAYGDVGARRCADLDVVVPPRVRGVARATLLREGFVSRRGMSAAQERIVMYAQGHADFARAPSVPFVELHWRFVGRRLPWTLSVHEVRARAERVLLGGVEVLAPRIDDQLLLLAWHGTRHGWAQFEWLVALGVFLQRGPVDAALVLKRAKDAGGRRAFLVGVQLARRVLGVSVAEVLERAAAADPAVEALVRTLEVRWVDGSLGTATFDAAFERACLERGRDRLWHWLATALLPTLREWEMVRLPAVLAPLYVPLRLIRLMWRRVGSSGESE